MTQNQINYQRHREDVRSHQSQEAETQRANRANEELTRSRDSETKRANLEREAETKRSNQAREAEEYRSNYAKELENNRSNLARELETNRSNLQNEKLNQEKINKEYAAKLYAADSSANATRYAANTSAGASRYAAERGYDSRTDTAYINKYGVSPTDVSSVANGVRTALPGIVESTFRNVTYPASVAASKILNKVVGGALSSGLAGTIVNLTGGNKSGKTSKQKQTRK